MEYALSCIIKYDGHEEWLEKLANKLEKTDFYKCPFDIKEWHTEEHTIWMLLVGMFGDWGTSIRGGWIDKTKEASKYIRHLIKGGANG
jgi:hypothetical protein